MDIEIVNEEEKPLMHRKDYTVRLASEGTTPSRAQVQKAVAKKAKGDEKLTVVRRIGSSFGESASIVLASVYEDEKAMDRYELAYMKDRHKQASGDAEESKEAEEAEDSEKKDEPEEKPDDSEEKAGASSSEKDEQSEDAESSEKGETSDDGQKDKKGSDDSNDESGSDDKKEGDD